MKKLVDANIKSKAEFIRRMIDGEAFHVDGATVFFREDGCRPFIYKNSSGAVTFTEWTDFNKMKVEVEHRWYDDLENGHILCWVWDGDKKPKYGLPVMIVECGEDGKFICIHGDEWDNAEPIKPEECYGYGEG